MYEVGQLVRIRKSSWSGWRNKIGIIHHVGGNPCYGIRLQDGTTGGGTYSCWWFAADEFTPAGKVYLGGE